MRARAVLSNSWLALLHKSESQKQSPSSQASCIIVDGAVWTEVEIQLALVVRSVWSVCTSINVAIAIWRQHKKCVPLGTKVWIDESWVSNHDLLTFRDGCATQSTISWCKSVSRCSVPWGTVRQAWMIRFYAIAHSSLRLRRGKSNSTCNHHRSSSKWSHLCTGHTSFVLCLHCHKAIAGRYTIPSHQWRSKHYTKAPI